MYYIYVGSMVYKATKDKALALLWFAGAIQRGYKDTKILYLHK